MMQIWYLSEKRKNDKTRDKKSRVLMPIIKI